MGEYNKKKTIDSTVKRIPRVIVNEISKIQRDYRDSGIDITFTEAAKIWYKKLKKIKPKFPDFV